MILIDLQPGKILPETTGTPKWRNWRQPKKRKIMLGTGPKPAFGAKAGETEGFH
jgi:hypothetical protein